jgi:hypothetical protein
VDQPPGPLGQSPRRNHRPLFLPLLVFAVAYLVVIPEGDLLLFLPLSFLPSS